VNIWTPCCGQSYNGLQVVFNQRLSHGLTLNANYAWSHTLDFGNCNFGCSGWQNEFNLKGEYSNADFDQRHNFETDFLYQPPSIHRLPSWLGTGWQVNGIVTAHSGAPYTVVTGVGPANDTDGSLRPDWNPGVKAIPSDKHVPSGPELNHLAFNWPTGEFGNVGRNPFYGPHWVNFDSSLFKNFKLRENVKLQLRVEAFDTFNHPDFGNPYASFNGLDPQSASFDQNNPSFGKSLGTVGGPRQLQFAARIDF
jgi:hypothetical protein